MSEEFSLGRLLLSAPILLAFAHAVSSWRSKGQAAAGLHDKIFQREVFWQGLSAAERKAVSNSPKNRRPALLR